MKMIFRWYGEGNDRIELSDIKQIPGVDGIVWTLHHKMPGKIWEDGEIVEVKRQLDEYGFNMDGVESLDVPECYLNTIKNKCIWKSKYFNMCKIYIVVIVLLCSLGN